MNTTVIERVRKRRQALRDSGLRPIQIWIPDTRRPDIAAECRRQSLLLRDDIQEKEVLSFIEAVADTEEWE